MNIKNKIVEKYESCSSLRDVFRKENGAIDLASIMVGMIVIGMLGGVIAATVFLVIPWTQDNAAKQQLDAIVVAESAYRGLSSSQEGVPAGIVNDSYGGSTQLAAAGLLPENKSKYCVVSTDEGKGYKAYAKSNSGSLWTVTHENSNPTKFGLTQEFKDSVEADCVDLFLDSIVPAYYPEEVTFDGPRDQLVMTYSSPTETTIDLPIRGGKGTVTWSDDVKNVIPYDGTTIISKRVTAGATYTVTIDGTFDALDYSERSGAHTLIAVNKWDPDTGTTSAANAFAEASNLVDVPAEIPATITDMSRMFANATSFNDPDIKHWETGNVEDMSYMFSGAAVFNQDIGDWDTSNVEDMSFMFGSWIQSSAFNQNIESWDTSNVTNMKMMFYSAVDFNKPLNDWNVSRVTDMSHMFGSAKKFNQNLDRWNTSSVRTMNGMFSYAPKFNQNISNWNTASVEDMGGMFAGASDFSQDLSGWDVSNVQTSAGFNEESRMSSNQSPFRA